MPEVTYKFLHKPNFHKVAEDFQKELQAASVGEKNNLRFIKTYLPQKPIISSGLVQVAVIGGTNYDFAVIRLHENGKKEIEFREKGKLDPFTSMDVFTDLLDTHLTTKVDAIALSLGFPLTYCKEEKGQPDGILIKATKEHILRGMLGQQVGHIVLDRYIRKHNSYTTVAVANDAVCLAEGDGGVIVGTGFNMSLRGRDGEEVYAVNLEAGNATSFEPTDELEEIDKNSMTRGEQRFEKLISGHYLPLHFNLLAEKFSIKERCTKAEELAEIATKDGSKAGELAREIFDRSAHYVAAFIVGLYLFKDSPKHMDLAIEGGLYLYGYKYQKSVQHALRELGMKKEQITFHTGKDSDLFGALKLIQ